MVWLYSGVAIITPSASKIFAENSATGAGAILSSGSLKAGKSLISKMLMSATFEKCFFMNCNNLRLVERAELVPTIATSFIVKFLSIFICTQYTPKK